MATTFSRHEQIPYTPDDSRARDEHGVYTAQILPRNPPVNYCPVDVLPQRVKD